MGRRGGFCTSITFSHCCSGEICGNFSSIPTNGCATGPVFFFFPFFFFLFWVWVCTMAKNIREKRQIGEERENWGGETMVVTCGCGAQKKWYCENLRAKAE